MRTAVAHDIESDHREGEGRPTVGLHLAETKREERDAHSIDATQGRKIGFHPYDDATQGRQIGSRPHDDATQGVQIASYALDDATQGRSIGAYAYDDATQGRQIGSRPSDDATQPRTMRVSLVFEGARGDPVA